MDKEHDRDGERNGDIFDARFAGHLAEVLNECRRITLDEGPVRGEFVGRSVADMVIAAAQLDDDDPPDASR